MKNTTNTLYYSRTETDQAVVIVWKPFSMYSTYIFVAMALLGSLFSITALSIIALFLLFVNAIAYSASCKNPRSEINEASRNSTVQVSGNKFSLSSPLTITIPKGSHQVKIAQESYTAPKQGSIVKKIVFGFFTTVFLILGLFVFSAFTSGIRQNIYVGSLIILFVLALIFFLLAYLCFKTLKKSI